MRKKMVGFITFFVGTLLCVTTAQGQFTLDDFLPFAIDDNEVLSGSYRFSTNGQAQLPISDDCIAGGIVAAALTDGSIHFDGRGSFNGSSNVGISIGATSCSSANYSLSGTYDVIARDSNSFAAIGKLTMRFQGRPAACSETFLVEQEFGLIGNIPEDSFTIQTHGGGEGSSYAEGPPPGPLTCTAKILNFLTRGMGTKNP